MEFAKLAAIVLLLGTAVPQVKGADPPQCRITLADARDLVRDDQGMLDAGWKSVFGESTECSELLGKAMVFLGGQKNDAS